MTKRSSAPRGATESAPDPVRGVDVRPAGDRATAARSCGREALAAVTWMLDAPERAHVDELGTIDTNLEQLIRQAADPIVAGAIEVLEGLGIGGGWEPLRDEPPAMFRDLRPSEALELRELVDQHVNAAVLECRTTIGVQLAAAAQLFASRHPDAPLGRWRDRIAQLEAELDRDAERETAERLRLRFLRGAGVLEADDRARSAITQAVDEVLDAHGVTPGG